MNEDSMETTDRFIIDTIEYIRKKNKKRVDKPTIINCVFNKSINVDKQVVEKRITFLTTNGTLENKPNGNKISFRVIDKAELVSDDVIDNTPATPKIFNTSTGAKVMNSLRKV